MNASLFFNNFSLLADSLNGVHKLREMILQLAVMGKLVPQDPNDEPASVLLGKIGEEKNKLIKAKLIRNSKPLPYVREEEYLFEIPTSWRWIRLGEIGDWGSGSTPDRKKLEYYDGTIRWFKSGELNNGYISESEEKITDIALNDCSLRLNKPGDVLIAMYGATIGKVAILKTEATTNQAVCACTCFNGMHNDYLFLLLKAYKQHFTGQGAGGAQPNISREKIINTVFPLPPLEEQKLIVAKVDQLMTLCDELEALHQHRNESRVHLNNAAVNKLLDACSVSEFNELWQLIYNNFDLLYDNLDNVTKLRQTILQLAVMGKLVPQDPNDEPASVLLGKIRDEKERLVKEGKIKGSMPLLSIEADEIPYNIPKNWKWIRFGEMVQSMLNGVYKEAKYYSDDGIACLRMYNINDGKINLNNLKRMVLENTEIEQYVLENGDLLVNRVNSRELVGKVAVIDNIKEPTVFESKNIRVRLMEKTVLQYYVNFLFRTSHVRKAFEGDAKQTCGQASISQPQISNVLLPLPPLEEQKRIVAKVDQLMTLCDELGMRIKKAQEDGDKITNAVVSNLTAM